jgi:hypothetical protein
MSGAMNRRTFLKVCGATAVSLATVGTGVVHARNRARYWTYGFDEGRYGEQTLIRKAVGIAVTRIQDERVWRNAYGVASRYFVTDDVMDNSNLRDSRDNRWNLLWHQLHWLSQPNGANATTPAFPNIHIRAGHDKDGGWVGRANLDLVTIRSTPDGGVTQSGDFDVTLNRYYVASGGVYSDPEEWASTLVHEMLHNLGHRHPTGDASLSDVYQINAMNNAVLCNGHYKDAGHPHRSANHLCGGRV